jgi:hypothetical protein
VIKSRKIEWAGNVTCMDERDSAYGVSVGKPEGKRPLGRPRRREENKFKTDFQGTEM